jgi:very-short-patch-repair endonuclease
MATAEWGEELERPPYPGVDGGRQGSLRGNDHRALAEMAERQHGVVSIRQLTGPLGYSQAAVARAAASGRLHRLYTGVYAVGHVNLSVHGRCLAAVLAGGPNAMLSHLSAAWLLGIAPSSPTSVHITGPVRRRARLPLRIHHSQILEPADRAVVDGIPVTALPRTLLDVAATARRRLPSLLDCAERHGLFDLVAVDALLARAGGHHGVKALENAIRLYRPPETTFSELERRFLAAVREADLPSPSANLTVDGYTLDVYWPDLRFAVELDVYETHGSHASFESDRLRHEDLKLHGVEMIRITGSRFDADPGAVIDRLRRHLDRRCRELALAPLGPRSPSQPDSG